MSRLERGRGVDGGPAPTVALGLVGAAMVVSAGLLLYWGRDQTIHGDDLEYAVRIAQQGLGHTLLHTPPNKYLIPIPLVLYDAMFEAFGLGSYLPLRIAAIALVILNGWLFFALARRSIGDLPAVAPTALLLLFGSGGSVLLSAERLPELIAVGAGLAALLMVRRQELRGDLAAAALLSISVASHPTGVAFTAAAAVLVVLRAAPGDWRRAWVFLAPLALFAAWWLFWRAASTPASFPTRFSSVVTFTRHSWTMLTASVSGLSGVLSDPVYVKPAAEIASALLFAALVAGVVWRFRRLAPTFWAAFAGLLVLIVATRLAPSGFLRLPDTGRYLYPEAFLFLLLFVELAAAVRPPRWLAWAATGVIALGLVVNLDFLNDAGRAVRAGSAQARGKYSAYEIAGRNVLPAYRESSFDPVRAGGYLDAAAKFGSAGLGPSELEHASLETRRAADQALVGSLGIGFRPAGRRGEAAGGSPTVERLFAARALRRRGCVELRPRTDSAVGSLAELRVASAGARVLASDPSSTRVLLGRFAEPSVAPVRPLGANEEAWLDTPPDGVATPWRLRIASGDAVSICGRPDRSGRAGGR